MREVAVGVGLTFVGFFVRRAGSDDGTADALTDAVERVARGGSVRMRGAGRGTCSGRGAAVAGVEEDYRALGLDARADDVGDLDHGQSGGEQIVFGLDFGVGGGDVIDLGGVFVARSTVAA